MYISNFTELGVISNQKKQKICAKSNIDTLIGWLTFLYQILSST